MGYCTFVYSGVRRDRWLLYPDSERVPSHLAEKETANFKSSLNSCGSGSGKLSSFDMLIHHWALPGALITCCCGSSALYPNSCLLVFVCANVGTFQKHRFIIWQQNLAAAVSRYARYLRTLVFAGAVGDTNESSSSRQAEKPAIC